MSLDTTKIKTVVAQLEAAQVKLASARNNYAVVKALNGQRGYDITVNGVVINVAAMNGQTYIAQLVRGREMMHLGALKALSAVIMDAELLCAKLESDLAACLENV